MQGFCEVREGSSSLLYASGRPWRGMEVSTPEWRDGTLILRN